MSNISSEGSGRPPGLRLSPRWLTVSLIAVTLIPVTLASTLWLAVPSTREPELPVDVFWEPVAWPRDASSDVRLMPGIRLHNPTPQRWTNLSMGINNQFYFISPDALDPGTDFSIPLSLFRTSGNQAFRPKTVRIRKFTVYAQLPGGSRAIYEVAEPQLELNP